MSETIEEALAHHGVKGMRWGVRRGSSSGGGGGHHLSPGQKKALKIGAAGVAVVGLAAATTVLAKNGKIPVSALRKAPVTSSKVGANMFEEATRRATRVTSMGKEATRSIDQHIWNTKVAELSKQIAEGHAEQAEYMRKYMNANPMPGTVAAITRSSHF